MNLNVNGTGYQRKRYQSNTVYWQVRGILSPGGIVEFPYIRAVDIAIKYPHNDGPLNPLEGLTHYGGHGSYP